MARFELASSLRPKRSGVTGLPNIPKCFFVDHVGIEPTTLSLQGRNAKPWYMTAQIN